MSVRETHSLLRQSVHAQGLNLAARVVAADVAIAQIIREDEHDSLARGRLVGMNPGCSAQGDDQCQSHRQRLSTAFKPHSFSFVPVVLRAFVYGEFAAPRSGSDRVARNRPERNLLQTAMHVSVRHGMIAWRSIQVKILGNGCSGKRSLR